MAMLPGDLAQVTLNGSLFGEKLSNVFYYEVADNAGNANLGQVLQQFYNDVVTLWLELVSEDYSLVDLRADNLTNDLDFYVLGLTGNGLTLSPSASSAVAGAISLAVSTRLTRPGSKRMGAVPEVYVQNNIWSPVPADINALLVALIQDLDLNELVTPIDCTMNPIIVGRFPITDPDAGKIDISRFQSITGAYFRDDITTQTSRRPGRGE